MQVVIIGCGRVGAMLAHLLEHDQHQVAIVDKQPTAFRRLGEGFRGRTITGIGFDRDVLREAGIERADALAAVTSGDNSNFIAAVVARDTFRVPTVVARIYDPQREQIYRRLGIRTISSTAWGAHKLKRMLARSDLHGTQELGNGEVQVLEARVPTALEGRPLTDLLYAGEICAFALIREGHAIVPEPQTVLQENDILHLSVINSAVDKIETLLQ